MNPSTVLAEAILDELVDHGVREIVISPGSRSAPLAYAALGLAQAGRVRLHVRIDERDAGFLALGLAKVSGAPVVVVCTSGTAVANLMPAAIEASYSAVPLVILTADRPPERRGIGAPQTIDQPGFFAANVRWSGDLSIESAAGVAGVRHEVAAAIAAAFAVGSDRGGHQGPVHLNIGFRPPLVPETARDHARDIGEPNRDRRRGRPPLPGCGAARLDEVLGQVPHCGVILVGDLPLASLCGYQDWIIELAKSCGWPIIAEPSANLHLAANALQHGVLVLGDPDFVRQHPADIVLSVGLFGLSRPTMELLRGARRHVAIELADVGREFCDPLRTADLVLQAIPLPPGRCPDRSDWLNSWLAADSVVSRVVADVVDPTNTTARELSAAGAARVVIAQAAAGALVLVAASWPVRQVEAYARPAGDLQIIGNRGANGIDGLISTAWGAALSHQARGGGPAIALIGDLAFLHDHNGLLVGPDEPRPDLTIVVLDNNGGGIFHQLEQGHPAHAAQFERLFATALDRDLVAITLAAGVPAVRVRDQAALCQELAVAGTQSGVRVIVIDVPDRVAEWALMQRVSEAVRLASAAG